MSTLYVVKSLHRHSECETTSKIFSDEGQNAHLGGNVSGDAVCTHNVLQDVGWVGAIKAHAPELDSNSCE